MQRQRYSIRIMAPRERVWRTLWEDETFRQWGNVIDEGQHMVGELEQGREVQFLSASGYGVTSLVEEIRPHAFVSFRQMADTEDDGAREREKEWTGGTESYSLAEDEGVTTLTVSIDVPHGLEETFQDRFPKALERIRILAEAEG